MSELHSPSAAIDETRTTSYPADAPHRDGLVSHPKRRGSFSIQLAQFKDLDQRASRQGLLLNDMSFLAPTNPMRTGALCTCRPISNAMNSWQERQLAELEHIASQIRTLQLADGAIASSEVHLNSQDIVQRPEVFASGLVAWLLTDLLVLPKAADCAKRVIDWLDSQSDGSGLWAFRGKKGEFPPDLDDTAVALLAIANHRRLKTKEAELLLLAFDCNNQGLLGTWVEGCPRIQTYDLTANLHAALALRRAGLASGALDLELAGQIGTDPGAIKSPYYCSPLPFLVASLQYLLPVTPNDGQLLQILVDSERAVFDLKSEQSIQRSACSPTFLQNSALYRRRSSPIFYFSDAAVLAYTYWLKSFRLLLSFSIKETSLE